MNDMAETFMNGARYRRYMSGRFSSFCEANDLSPVDVKVLLFLEGHSGEENRMSDIVRKEVINKGFISQSVMRLKKRGLLNLEEDKADRRVRHLSLTASSDPMVRVLRAMYEDTRADIFSGVSQEDKEVFFRVMRKISENLDKRQSE